jgi:hypothetical protein
VGNYRKLPINSYFDYKIAIDDQNYKILKFISTIRSHHDYHHVGGLSYIDLAKNETVDFTINMEEIIKEYKLSKNLNHGMYYNLILFLI